MDMVGRGLVMLCEYSVLPLSICRVPYPSCVVRLKLYCTSMDGMR